MKRILLLAAAVLVAVVIAVVILIPKGPDPAQFEHLKTPRISEKPARKVIVVKATGSPQAVGAKAFKLLFTTYFKLKATPKGPRQPAPRARWPISEDMPKEEWTGLYAMPVPDAVTELPDVPADSGLSLSLDVWRYGETAEILHVGPYDREKPTINRLKAFIDSTGYEIAGMHEEEYIKGPTMFGPGNPEKYLTIIRYPVRKKTTEHTKDTE